MAKDWKAVAGLVDAEKVGKVRQIDLISDEAEVPVIAWLGHACFLIRWCGRTLMVDPVFRKWIGFFPRQVPFPDLKKIGRVDTVLISHGHMDHLDEGSLKAVAPDNILIPNQTAGFLGRELVERCTRLEVGDSVKVGRLTATVVKAMHGGWRYPWQRGYVACGFIVSDGSRTIYLAGDSAYGDHFLEIGRRWKIDTALLPIGAYSPQFVLQDKHMNPEEACQAAVDLSAGEVIPFHFGSYRLSLEPLDEPLRRFAIESERREIEWHVPLGI